VILPSYLDAAEQKKLVRWSLESQAREPNPTNLDIHYHIPREGLWNVYVQNPDSTILPKALDSDVVEEPSSGPRQLVNNTPASIDNFQTLAATPKPPPAPSPSAQPTTPSNLLTKLRWANIGWYYHWGTKQYDFSRGKAPIDKHLQFICKSAVASVNWSELYNGSEGVEWDKDEPEWKSWDSTYGE